jgi:PPK2 family polyphosphate:nucleotide phosphotransferase
VFEPALSPYTVPYDGSFRRAEGDQAPPPDAPGKKECKSRLKELRRKLRELQSILYAHDHHAVLLVFQAMDAAGKDGTISAVMRGVNPTGCQVSSFKQPSAEELDHDFLWRTSLRLPERGRIGIFNRSYYEEVLVVRVHPEYLEGQNLPETEDRERLWEHRFQSIVEHERHLARNGTVILKFWLDVSKDEQRKRFLARLDEPEKNWKFSEGDVRERGHWDAYMSAYEEVMRATSRPWAPWFQVPADDKPFMRVQVAEIVVRALEDMGLHYPEVDPEARARFAEMRQQLAAED